MNQNQNKVLIVDDDPDQLMMLAAVVEHGDFHVETAHNSSEALQLARQKHFDVVVTDISMPEMNGLELAKLLRETPGNHKVPVILVTAGKEAINFSKVSFRANGFCLKRDVLNGLVPSIKAVL